MVDILPIGFAQVFTLVVIILVILALHFGFWFRKVDFFEIDEIKVLQTIFTSTFSAILPGTLFIIISGETPRLWVALVCFGGFALLEWIVLAIKELSICWWLYVYQKEIVDNTLSETERRMVKNLQRYKAVKAETKAEKRESDEQS